MEALIVPWLHGRPNDLCIKTIAFSIWEDVADIVDPQKDTHYQYWCFGNITSHLNSLEQYALSHDVSELILIGHSLWALASIIFASRQRVKWLILVNPQLWGYSDLRASLLNFKESTRKWKENGFQIRMDQWWSKYNLPWEEYWKRSFQYNALESSNCITIPTVVMVWTNDSYVYPKGLKIFFDRLAWEKKLETLPIDHVPKGEQELSLLWRYVQEWKIFIEHHC